MDYLALIRSALKNKGAIDDRPDTGYYHLMIRRSYEIDDDSFRPYVTYVSTDGYYRNYLIARPDNLWERTKILIMLTTAILKVEKV